MTWSLLGWVIILLAAVLLALSSFLFKKRIVYNVRHLPAVKRLVSSRITAIERGRKRHIMLGHQFWSRTYPGLGLQALSMLPVLVDSESAGDGGQVVFVGDGGLLALARQITSGSYRDGFSERINDSTRRVTLLGITPHSFTAGFLPELTSQKPGSVALFGNYGTEAALWAAAASDRGGDVFAAAGSLESQAALFLFVRDLLIGEEAFLMPGLIRTTPADQAGWFVEDILRVLLIALLIAGAALKLGGIL